jgi:hypothetical protein
MDEPSFRAGWHLFRCWRGPAWMNTAWMLVPPMRRLGYAADADRLVASLVALVERHGFREYYNPLNGEGLAARHFGWSTLLVDLLPPSGPASAPSARAPGRRGEPSLLGETLSAGREAVSAVLRAGRGRRAPRA